MDDSNNSSGESNSEAVEDEIKSPKRLSNKVLILTPEVMADLEKRIAERNLASNITNDVTNAISQTRPKSSSNMKENPPSFNINKITPIVKPRTLPSQTIDPGPMSPIIDSDETAESPRNSDEFDAKDNPAKDPFLNSEFLMTSQEYDSMLHDLKVYNVLLLGETGSGKSTSVNAIANYLKFAKFDEAKQAPEFLNLIPCKFTLPHPETGQPQEIHSKTSDPNEVQGGNLSCTQAPRAYTFMMDGWILRLIDTPGIGDTSGLEQDRANFDKILAHLHNYKQLHGILLLIKSSETRQTAFFRYCITELFTHLHKSACKNLVFCFTFSRSSFYGPSDGFATLSNFILNELKLEGIELTAQRNAFFIDNEAYRYLVAAKQDFPFAEHNERSFHESWDKSVEQTNKMWNYIKGLDAHEIASTQSLNNARKLIENLAEPMVRLQQLIKHNIAEMHQKQMEIEREDNDKQKLAATLMLDVDDLECEPLQYPSTVCTAPPCIDVIQFDGEQKINYKQRCHEDCGVKAKNANHVGNPAIKKCSRMSRKTGMCKVCGCGWEKHIHLKCTYKKVRRSIVDTNQLRRVRSKEEAIRELAHIKERMSRIALEYQAEHDVIEEVSQKFAYLLNAHANTPFNNYFEPYIDLLIEEEKQKTHSVNGYSRETLDNLIKTKATHAQSVAVLTRAIKAGKEQNVRLEDIESYRDKLCSLPHNGGQFRKILDNLHMMQAKETQGEMRENVFDFSSRKRLKRFTANALLDLGRNFMDSWKPSSSPQPKPKVPQKPSKLFGSLPDPILICILCSNRGHTGMNCAFETSHVRAETARSKKLCLLCLQPEHKNACDCTRPNPCVVCDGAHCEVLCPEIE